MTAKKSTVGQFYAVSRGAITHVAEHSDRAAVVLAYLALKRYQQRNYNDVVSGGRMALAKILGVSQRRAMNLMNELRAIAWGKGFKDTAMIDAHTWNAACDESEAVPLGHAGGGKGSNKVMPPCGDDFIYLPNSLTEQAEQKQYTPLGQLYHLEDKETRLHATMLLLALYEHLDMQHFGGADPTTTIYIPWRYDGTADHPELSEYDEEMQLGYMGQCDGLHYWVVDFRHADGKDWADSLTSTQWTFIESITGETSEGKEAPLFWKAAWALRELGLTYHAAMVFDADPLVDPDADVLYPFWMFNPAERERLNNRGHHEGGLAQLAANNAERHCIEPHSDSMELIYLALRGSPLEPTGWFIVATDNPNAKVVGIVRPRFIPNTADGQAGWISLRDKAAKWASRLER